MVLGSGLCGVGLRMELAPRFAISGGGGVKHVHFPGQEEGGSFKQATSCNYDSLYKTARLRQLCRRRRCEGIVPPWTLRELRHRQRRRGVVKQAMYPDRINNVLNDVSQHAPVGASRGRVRTGYMSPTLSGRVPRDTTRGRVLGFTLHRAWI